MLFIPCPFNKHVTENRDKTLGTLKANVVLLAFLRGVDVFRVFGNDQQIMVTEQTFICLVFLFFVFNINFKFISFNKVLDTYFCKMLKTE